MRAHTPTLKTPVEVADHPMAVLYREVVAVLRRRGSIEGAERAWPEMLRDPHLSKRLITFGLGEGERQAQLSRVAFPKSNYVDVDLALAAGNKLRDLYALACGEASIARDAAGRPQVGRKGWKVVAIIGRAAAVRRGHSKLQ